MRYWTARTGTACAQRLVCEIADFSASVRRSRLRRRTTIWSACKAGWYPPVLGFGSVGSAQRAFALWCLSADERRNNFGVLVRRGQFGWLA